MGRSKNSTVTFNVPIDPNSFATTDARVVGPGGEVTVIDIEQLDATTYRVNVERTTEDGDYQIFIGPDITDPAGNPMDGDGDAIAGELEDRYVGSLQVAGGGPFVTSMTPTGIVSPGVAGAEITFSEPVRLTTFTAADIVFDGPDGLIPITDIQPTGPEPIPSRLPHSRQAVTTCFRSAQTSKTLAGCRWIRIATERPENLTAMRSPVRFQSIRAGQASRRTPPTLSPVRMPSST